MTALAVVRDKATPDFADHSIENGAAQSKAAIPTMAGTVLAKFIGSSFWGA
jgi:hypothetical protein